MHATRLFVPVLMALGLLMPLAVVSYTNTSAAELAQLLLEVDTGAYEVVENWPQPLPDTTPGEHDGFTWGSGAGAHAETPDKVWVAQRGERPLPRGAEPWTIGAALIPPRMETGRDDYGLNIRGWERRVHHVIFAVNREGRMIEEWRHLDDFFYPTGLMGRGPHKILTSPYDPENHLWVIDDDLHEIHKFTNSGELVMTLGERNVPGRGPNNFNRPTDIAWLPDGTFFVADGYAGTRVAKFDAEGKFLLDWGQPPADLDNQGPNEFWSVHSIGISRDRRIFVADREHNRMQVFDENGTFLDMWPTGYRSAVYAHIVTQDDHVWVADRRTERLVKYDLNGRYVYDMGGPGFLPGQFGGVHQIHVDEEGNLYVTEVWNGRSQKFRPKADADPAHLVAPRVGDWQ